MFGRPRPLQVSGSVFFTVFKSSDVSPPAAAAESISSMWQSVPPERYPDDWGDHLFHSTFTQLSQRLRLGALVHPAGCEDKNTPSSNFTAQSALTDSAGIPQQFRAEEMATAAGPLCSTGTADSWGRCVHHY